MMKRLLYTTLTFIGLLSMVSCEEFLSRDPYDRISSEAFWTSENDLVLYSTGLLNSMIPSESIITRGNDIYTDLCAGTNATSLVRAAEYVTPDNQSGWSEGDWRALRRVNYMLDNMEKCRGVVSDEVYRHYEGVARFWRAWFYYSKVRNFGAVPWYEHVVSSSDQEALYKGRDSREFVMDKILEDLNFAVANCSSAAEYVNGSYQINKWTALAFKSRVCLFEGTYRKYHNVDPSTQKTWNPAYNENNKFLREAAAAAKQIMDEGPFSLVSNYRSLFISAAIQSQEVIFGREYSQTLSALHEASWVYQSPTYGNRTSFVKDFVDTFLMTDGTPFTDQQGYATKRFYNDADKSSEFDNRDARMSQIIAAPGYEQVINGTVTPFAPNWTVTRTGYQPIKWCLDSNEGNVYERGASWNSLPILRYGEVLLNYAEAMAELGECDQTVWNQTIARLRARGGVASIYPTAPDQYMQKYFLDTVTDPVILEIRRERGCELCLEMGLRWDDLMRWHMGDKLSTSNGPWRGIWVGSASYSHDFTGQSTNALNEHIPDFSIATSGSETTRTITIAGTGGDQTFSIGADGNLVWEYARVWREKCYIRPIPTTAIVRNPNLEQNELWK